MPTLSQVLKGTRARKLVDFPLPGAKAKDGGGFDGDTVQVAVRVLSPTEIVTAREKAAEYATQRGSKAEEGEPIYDLAFRAHTIAIAVLDADQEDVDAPFFDGGFDQIMTADGLTDAHYAYLHELVEQFQFECSPRIAKLTSDVFQQVTKGLVQQDYLPFLRLARGTQALYMRSLASLYVSSLQSKSPSGGSSASELTS